MWTGWGVFIFLYFFLVCPCCSGKLPSPKFKHASVFCDSEHMMNIILTYCLVRRKYPLNLVMLGLISIAMGWSLGATCCFYDFDEIVQ